MTEEKTSTKIDISSTAIEKSIDVAKNFAEKLVLPSVEELGLLVKDQISYWRFNNQVKILTKAKALCERNNISIKAITPKLLCPYLEYASLEDDPQLQKNWATLLSNMVDSQQNIQNHVFPYILSQLSKDEFTLLESVFEVKRQRVTDLTQELTRFQDSRPDIESQLQERKTKLEEKIKKDKSEGVDRFDLEAIKSRSELQEINREINLLNYKENIFKRKISVPQEIPEANVKEFEIANIIRLGLAKVVYEASAGTHRIEIPDRESYASRSVDFDIEIETETNTILTELGELFIEACCDK